MERTADINRLPKVLFFAQLPRENGQRDFLPPVTVKARALLTNWKKK